LYGYPENYVDFDVPWNLSFSYNFNYNKPYDEATITQNVRMTGDFNLTNKWKISFGSGYDFILNKATYTTIDIYRDLHCWEASLHLVPFGAHKAYMFQINVKASMLKDLKLAKRRSWYDNF
ncbi:MAG: LPS-assembly protein LptD, partial [Bacteroidales bacterium]|nr:LPS-assembly protein LptD [Bacteroidales bacterium]